MRNGVLKQVAELERLDRKDLVERWRSLFGGEPPAYSKDMLVRRLAHRIQELAYGGLSEATRDRLRSLAPEDRLETASGEARKMERRRRIDGIPVPGTLIIREWGGRRHEVTVLPTGFEYGGRSYRSLSAIAAAITGTHWNGPLFFGLRGSKPRKGA